MKCILCETSEVYNVLFHNRAVNIYTGKHTSYPNYCVHLTRLNYDIYFIQLSIIQLFKANTFLFWYHMPENNTQNTCSFPSYTSTSSYESIYTKIYMHTHICKNLPNSHHTPLNLYILLKSYMCHYLCVGTSLLQRKNFMAFNKTYPGYITFYSIISSCNPVPIIVPGGWGTSPSEACRNNKP